MRRGSTINPKGRQKTMSESISLDISKILEILPHRYPFLLVDRVTDLVPARL